MASFSDNFNRADNPALGSPWAEDEESTETFRISANRNLNNTGAQWGIAKVDQTWVGDQAAEMKFKARTNNPLHGPAVRVQGTRTSMSAYAVIVNPFTGIYELRKYVNESIEGGGTNLATSTQDAGVPPVDTVIRIEARGSSIKAFRNGVEFMSATDGVVAGGKPGMVAQDRGHAGSMTWDDFFAEDFAPARGPGFFRPGPVRPRPPRRPPRLTRIPRRDVLDEEKRRRD